MLSIYTTSYVQMSIDYASFEMIALVYSTVEALPPKSPVMALPSAIVCKFVRADVPAQHMKRDLLSTQPFRFYQRIR